MDGAAVHHAVVQEELVHVVTSIVMLLDVFPAACDTNKTPNHLSSHELQSAPKADSKHVTA
jgi:hypothetical protein